MPKFCSLESKYNNNISRHIKDSVWNFEFVTELVTVFLYQKVLYYDLYIVELLMFLKPHG